MTKYANGGYVSVNFEISHAMIHNDYFIPTELAERLKSSMADLQSLTCFLLSGLENKDSRWFDKNSPNHAKLLDGILAFYGYRIEENAQSYALIRRATAIYYEPVKRNRDQALRNIYQVAIRHILEG